MKRQILCSGQKKKKKNISKYRLSKILPRELSIKEKGMGNKALDKRSASNDFVKKSMKIFV